MSQNAIALPTTGTLPGATGVADINAAYLTLATLASGGSAPTTAGLGIGSTAGVFWHDTTNNVINIRNQADSKWVTLFHLDETNGVAAPNAPVSAVSTAQSISGTNHFANFVFTGSTARTFTFARANTLWNGFSGTIFNESSAALTLTPNGSDAFNGGAAGSSIVVPPGYVANYETDAAASGTWWTSIEPATLGSGSIASAATCDIGSIAFENVTVTGTTTITSLGATGVAGQTKNLTFSGALTFTYNATSLILPGAANITTAAGDTAVMQCLGSGNWKCLAYQTASGKAVAGGVSASYGFLNKIRNGAFDIWQRGTASITVSTSGAYTADGWIVLPAGASVAAAQAADNRTGALSQFGLQVTGATSVTDVKVKQRVEGAMAAPLTGQAVTIQAWVFNNTGGSITPTIAVNFATATDNWGSVGTDLAAANLQACANGAWTQIAYSYTAGSSCAKGLEVIFDFGNNFSAGTKTLILAEVDVRVTAGIATGLNAAPPTAELRPIQTELALCQRYFSTSYGNGVPPGAVTYAGIVSRTAVSGGASNGSFGAQFPTTMRAAPTVSTWDGAGNAGKFSFNNAGTWSDNQGAVALIAAATGQGGFTASGTTGLVAASLHFSASAEL